MTTKRRQRMPRVQREEAMLDAAGAAFAEHGFHGASMDAIAAAAEISKPMLYAYFGSKEGLYAAYVERSGRALMTAMREAAPPDAPAAERLEAGVQTFFDYVGENGTSWSVLYNEAAAQGGPLAAEVAALRARLVDMVLRALVPGGGAAGDSALAFAHAFVGAGESLANWWLAHPGVPEEEVVRLMLRFAEVALPRAVAWEAG
jgi:AcrR family transcriptional regulator